MSKMNWEKTARNTQRQKDRASSDPFSGPTYTTRFDSAVKTIRERNPSWPYDKVIQVAQEWLAKVIAKERA